MTRTLLLLLLVAACKDKPEDTADTGEILEPPSQASEAPDPTLRRDGFVAVIISKETSEVIAPYTSQSAKLMVKLGDHVDQGAVLAKLDDRQLRQELDSAIAQERTASAAVMQADVDRRAAEVNLDREKKAEAEKVGSHADVVAAEFGVQKAKAAIQRAAAARSEQQTKISQLQAHLTEMTLVAPRAGSVALIYVQDGARVEEGRPVVRLISSDEMNLKFAIPADKINTVKPGDRIDITCEQHAGTLEGAVTHVAPDLDSVAQMIIAEADLVNPPKDLTSGLTCRAVPRATKH